MQTLGILLLFASCFLGDVCKAELTVQISSKEVTPGDDVTVHCTLKDFHYGQYINWFKRQEDEWVVVGTATEIIGDFAETTRYSVDQRSDGDDVHFILHIRGVTYADSGDLGCATGHTSESNKIFTSLTVMSPPEDIKLFAMESVESRVTGIEYNDGERVKYKDGESFYFQCKTSSSNPPVDFIMTLGERVFTSHFEKVSSKYVRGAKPGLREIYYETVATTIQAVNMTIEASEQLFTCAASVQNYEPISISITPYIVLSPKVECQNEVLSPLHGKNTELSCRVTSTEPLTDVMWAYARNDVSRTATILRNDENEGHYFSRIKKDADGLSADAKLLIDTVTLTSFRDYTLIANNSIGSNQASVSLRRDLTKESTHGAAGSLHAGATLLSLVALISYL